jgi:hypothetical protein
MRSLLVLPLLCLIATPAATKDDGKWAMSPNKEWFDSLRSGLGPCCSDADGAALAIDDWAPEGTSYRVRVNGRWYHVPDSAVLRIHNILGHAMVWPIEETVGGFPTGNIINIRCFLPGDLS